MDRLIRDALEAREPAAPAPCLDPETLAGWVDGALDARARAAVEAHAADCARCQMLLAAMARTEPAVATGSRWHFGGIRWLIPAVAAAAAVALWVEVREPAVAPSPGPSAATTTMTAPPPAAETFRAAADREKAVASIEAPAKTKPSEPAPRRDELKERQLQKKEAGQTLDAATPTTDLRARAETSNKRAAAGAETAQAPPAPVAPAAPAAPPPPPASREAAASRIQAFARAQLIEIITPGSAVRWRFIRGGSAVERSADGGATWQVQPIGVAVRLTAGSSPAPSVCWAVGDGGLVVLSTDGAAWHRLTFPEAVDLVAVQARDEKAATVRTADGRRFSTTDGGLTWSAPQEFPAAPFKE